MRGLIATLAFLAAAVSVGYATLQCITCTTKIVSGDPYITTLIPNPNQQKYKNSLCEWNSTARILTKENCYGANAKCVRAVPSSDTSVVYRGCYTSSTLCGIAGNLCCATDSCNGAVETHSVTYVTLGLVTLVVGTYLL